MPSTPTTRLRVEKQALGENLNSWGDARLNDALQRLDDAIAGIASITISGASTTLTSSNYSDDQARRACLVFSGTLTANSTVTVPNVEKMYLAINNTAGAFSLTLKTAAGSGYALRSGAQWVYCNGTDVLGATPRLDQLPLATGDVDLNAQRLTNLGTPSASTDAATKTYVDAVAGSATSAATSATAAAASATSAATSATSAAANALSAANSAISAASSSSTAQSLLSTKADLASPTFSGNIGLGRSPYVTSGYTTLAIQGADGGVVEMMDTAGTLFGRIYSQPTDKLVVQNSRATGKIHFAISASDAMMIDSNRHLLIGTTALAPGYFDNTNTGFVIRSNGQFFQNAPDFSTMGRNTAGTVLAFNLASVWKGSIDLSSGGTAYLTSSDHRLKGGVVPLTGALERIGQLKPARFHFLEQPDETVDGFLAHEVQETAPYAVSGEKDATDANGNPVYQGLDYSKLTPLLVGAVQELAARVAALENRANG
jgi:hypothetical protein